MPNATDLFFWEWLNHPPAVDLEASIPYIYIYIYIYLFPVCCSSKHGYDNAPFTCIYGFLSYWKQGNPMEMLEAEWLASGFLLEETSMPFAPTLIRRDFWKWGWSSSEWGRLGWKVMGETGESARDMWQVALKATWNGDMKHDQPVVVPSISIFGYPCEWPDHEGIHYC